MFRLIGLCFGILVRLFRGRQSLLLENLALRQQLVTLKRRHPRPRFGSFDKLFWAVAQRVCSEWEQALLVVTPETVVRWHRTGFRMYWRLISRVRKQVGRRPTPKEVRKLIFRMVAENPTWGAPRIHGELLMLGFDLSERTISRWMKRAPRDPDRAKRWRAFLRNHREAIVAMDFFTVPHLFGNQPAPLRPCFSASFSLRHRATLLCDDHSPQDAVHEALTTDLMFEWAVSWCTQAHSRCPPGGCAKAGGTVEGLPCVHTDAA
jgi:hypothetical protein